MKNKPKQTKIIRFRSSGDVTFRLYRPWMDPTDPARGLKPKLYVGARQLELEETEFTVSKKDAAVREAEEETGFRTKITSLAGIINKIMYDKEGKLEYHYVLINYFVEQIEGPSDQPPVAADDALDAKFVPFEELKDYILTESLIELLKRLKIGFE